MKNQKTKYHQVHKNIIIEIHAILGKTYTLNDSVVVLTTFLSFFQHFYIFSFHTDNFLSFSIICILSFRYVRHPTLYVVSNVHKLLIYFVYTTN